MKRYILPLLAIALVGCKQTEEKKIESSDDAKMEYRMEVNEVEVDTLRLRPFERELVSNGRLTAHRRSKLNFQLSGVVASVNVANGGRIAAGGAIATLDNSEHKLALERAELALKKSHLSFLDELVKLGYKLGDTITPPADAVELARIRSGYADAKMSHASVIDAPSQATSGKDRRKLSPRHCDIRFGTTSPRNGMNPTVTTIAPVTAATIVIPKASMAVGFSPSPRATSSPSPASVKRSAANQPSTVIPAAT